MDTFDAVLGALNDAVVLHPRIAVSVDEFGSVVDGFGPPTTWCGTVQLGAVAEDHGDRDQQTQFADLFLVPDCPVRGRDRIEWRGETWEIVGEPQRLETPYQPGRTHHIEAQIRRTRG